ncbi:MAG: gas vesicle protein GvpG, partial [Chloroflexi bacterium]|nr:gas vesicle protein GvpG [Chloroflexota bacterium]
FIAEQIQAEAESVLLDEGRVVGALAALSLRHSTGQISGPEFEAEEEALLDELEAIRAYKEALAEEEAALYADYEDDDYVYEAEYAAEFER